MRRRTIKKLNTNAKKKDKINKATIKYIYDQQRTRKSVTDANSEKKRDACHQRKGKGNQRR